MSIPTVSSQQIKLAALDDLNQIAKYLHRKRLTDMPPTRSRSCYLCPLAVALKKLLRADKVSVSLDEIGITGSRAAKNFAKALDLYPSRGGGQVTYFKTTPAFKAFAINHDFRVRHGLP